MKRAAIVPKRERADSPIEATGEFWLGLVLEQEIEQWRALGLGHVLETQRVAKIDVKRLASGFWMRAHYGMFADIFLFRFSLAAIACAVLARASHVRLGRMIDCD